MTDRSAPCAKISRRSETRTTRQVNAACYRKGERGSVVTYLLIAVALLALLTVMISEGPKKNPLTQQLDTLILTVASDLKTIEGAADDCMLIYPAPVDIDGDHDQDTSDNPNTPFPVIFTTTYGTSGTLDKVVCPGVLPVIATSGTPTAQQSVFSVAANHPLKLLGDTGVYTTTYTTNTTDGVYIKVVPVNTLSLWPEAAARVKAKYSACKSAVVKDAGSCSKTCLYVWIKRLPTSVIGGTCP